MAKTRSSDLPHNLVGFVSDPESEQVINDVIKNMGIAFSEASQETLPGVVEFLKNNRSPKILIVDITEFELPLGDVAKIKEHCTPNVNIIAIGTRNDVGLFRDLKAMGIVDYLIKPLNNNLLQHAVEVANGVSKGYVEKSGKMVQFVSSIGGAGATTASCNVAWLLANRHFKRSAILDMDFLYGVVNLMLDIKVDNAYLDVLESPEKIDDYFIETIFKKYDQRLYYLGGLVDLVRGVVVDTPAFEALITMIKKQFNYILVDSQRELNSINRICMNKADSFVVMVEMSVASAQNTVRMLELFNTDQAGKKVIIVANKVGLSARGALSKESFEKIIDRKIDYVMPLDESIALAAANIGQPLAMSSGPLADVLEGLADNIAGKLEKKSLEQIIEEDAAFSINKIKKTAFDALDKVMKSFGK